MERYPLIPYEMIAFSEKAHPPTLLPSQVSDFIICDLAFFVRLAFNTMSLSGGSPLYETRFLRGNDEPLHILSAAFYPPYELC